MTDPLTSADRSYHFDVRQFHRMMAAGIFGDQKVERVAGKVYEMTDLPPHTFAVGRLFKALLVMLAQGAWTIRGEQPVLIGRYWAPKPDMVAVGNALAGVPPRRSGSVGTRGGQPPWVTRPIFTCETTPFSPETTPFSPSDAVLDGRPVSDDQRPSTGCNIKWKPGSEPD